VTVDRLIHDVAWACTAELLTLLPTPQGQERETYGAVYAVVRAALEAYERRRALEEARLRGAAPKGTHHQP
jgi:hypothetical protein